MNRSKNQKKKRTKKNISAGASVNIVQLNTTAVRLTKIAYLLFFLLLRMINSLSGPVVFSQLRKFVSFFFYRGQTLVGLRLEIILVRLPIWHWFNHKCIAKNFIPEHIQYFHFKWALPEIISFANNNENSMKTKTKNKMRF